MTTVEARYDVAELRSRFPALAGGTAFFDGPGGSQTPAVVAEAVAGALTGGLANRGTVTAGEQAAEAIVVAAREAMGYLLGADARGIVFGRSMTALTFDLARTLARTWGPGDEVVVTTLDHDANVRPWVVAAERAGAVVRWADFDPETGELEVEHVARHLGSRTRLVAVTGASNLIGTRPPVAQIAEEAHGAGALMFVDGVHLTAHEPVDVVALGADVYACSPYKVFGPHCGVLAADPALLEGWHPDKLAPSTDVVPERFELGTLPYELLAGVTAMVDFVAGLAPGPGGDRRQRVLASMAAVAAREDGLRRRIEAGLTELPGARLHGRARLRTPTILTTFEGRGASDAHRFLATLGVNAPAGSFYAAAAARRLGLGDAGGLRVGVAPYTDDGDVERLLDGLWSWLRS